MQTDRHTHRDVRDQYTFCFAMPNAKCNKTNFNRIKYLTENVTYTNIRMVQTETYFCFIFHLIKIYNIITNETNVLITI